jgi:hypothetical protein
MLMSDDLRAADIKAARRDGEAFGRIIGTAAAAKITRVRSDYERARLAGVEGFDVIMARAEGLADVTADCAVVGAWTVAATGAFREELDRGASLRVMATPVGLKH